MSLKEDDAAAGKVATAPRVSMKEIESNIEQRFTFNGLDLKQSHPISYHAAQALSCLTIAVVVLKNGFCVVGTSAPASPANYDKELGEKFAYENALRQIWPFMGFALRQHLYEQKLAQPNQEPPAA